MFRLQITETNPSVGHSVIEVLGTKDSLIGLFSRYSFFFFRLDSTDLFGLSSQASVSEIISGWGRQLAEANGSKGTKNSLVKQVTSHSYLP